MALMELTLSSRALGGNTTVWVCFPEETGGDLRQKRPPQYQPGVKYQTLWLLHGGGDDGSCWPRFTNIERYAADHKLIVVCPSAYASFYSDMYYGGAYFTWISEELPQILRWMLPISTKREDNFVAGLSMGGYGSLKWAVNHPEQFAAAGSFSGAVDMPGILKQNHLHDGILDDNFVFSFGSLDRVENTSGDVLYMAHKLKNEGVELPDFYVTVGTEDFTYKFNAHLRDKFREDGIELTWDERPGTHCWEYWDAAVQRFINWLPLKNTPVYQEVEA